MSAIRNGSFGVWLERRRQRRRERDRTSWLWCPKCRRDLNGDDDSFVSDEDVVTYRCATCGHVSRWSFDFPVPVLLGRNGRPVAEIRTLGEQQ